MVRCQFATLKIRGTADVLINQVAAHYNVMRMDAATKRRIVYGVDEPRITLTEMTNKLLGIDNPQKIRFLVPSEMGYVRMKFSLEEAKENSEASRLQKCRPKMNKASEDRFGELMGSLRTKLHKHYMSELEVALEKAKRKTVIEGEIRELFASFIGEVRKDRSTVLVDNRTYELAVGEMGTRTPVSSPVTPSSSQSSAICSQCLLSSGKRLLFSPSQQSRVVSGDDLESEDELFLPQDELPRSEVIDEVASITADDLRKILGSIGASPPA